MRGESRFTDLKNRTWALDVMLSTLSFARVSSHRMARLGSIFRKSYVARPYVDTIKISKVLANIDSLISGLSLSGGMAHS